MLFSLELESPCLEYHRLPSFFETSKSCFKSKPANLNEKSKHLYVFIISFDGVLNTGYVFLSSSMIVESKRFINLVETKLDAAPLSISELQLHDKEKLVVMR